MDKLEASLEGRLGNGHRSVTWGVVGNAPRDSNSIAGIFVRGDLRRARALSQRSAIMPLNSMREGGQSRCAETSMRHTAACPLGIAGDAVYDCVEPGEILGLDVESRLRDVLFGAFAKFSGR